MPFVATVIVIVIATVIVIVNFILDFIPVILVSVHVHQVEIFVVYAALDAAPRC